MNVQKSPQQKPVVLAVDDTLENLTLLRGLLRNNYRTLLANGGSTALRMARGDVKPDIILLDVMMPDIDGYEVCRQLKKDPMTSDIPIIFLTARIEMEDEEMGLKLGAVDYVTKPISPPILMARLANHLLVKNARDFLTNQNTYLQNEVEARTAEIKRQNDQLAAIQDVTILAMASLAETRDSETGNHVRRTQFYVKILAEKLREHHRFAEILDDSTISMMFKSAPLHDIGKVGIPDKILLKPGRFEPHEFEIMKSHTTLGRDAIHHAECLLGITVDFLSIAKEIAYSHQEKWDGSGYPLGISGNDIPLSARLMAVADVYDALTSRRVYKEKMPHEDAVQIIIEGAGSHFDPDIIKKFVQVQPEFNAISCQFSDT